MSIYRQAYEILGKYPDADENTTIRLQVRAGTDQRRYNLPTVDEVAVIIPGDGMEARDGRDIILYRHNATLQCVCDGHPAYSCLRYVLFFPHGGHGWHYNICKHSPDARLPRHVTQTCYTAFLMHHRCHDFNIIL